LRPSRDLLGDTDDTAGETATGGGRELMSTESEIINVLVNDNGASRKMMQEREERRG